MNNRVDEILNTLSLEQKIGQMICIGLNTTYVDDEFKELVQKYHFGGIGLYNRNIDNIEQIKSLTEEIQATVMPSCNGIKAMIAIDEEGGIVSHFISGITYIPGNFAIGATGSEKNAFDCGHILGLELSDIGITINWAPVVDLNNNLLNGVVDIRSFGDEPQLVSSLGAAMACGFNAGGIGATAKHYPGHGNAIYGKDLIHVINTNSKEYLLENDLVPFKVMADKNIDAMMVGPIDMPAFEDGEYIPATLSHRLLTDILRKEFNYNGVIMIDDLNFQAIMDKYTLKKAAQMTISAGADMIIMCHSTKHQLIVYNTLLNAVKSGKIKMERIDESVRRIIRMKLNIEEYRKKRVNINAIEKSHRIERVCEESIVLVNDPESIIPADSSSYKKVLVILPHLVSVSFAEVSEPLYCSLGEQLSSEFDNVKILTLSPSPSNEAITAVFNAASNYDLIIIATENCNSPSEYLNLVNMLASIKPLIIVSLRHPYETKFFPKNAAAISSFCPINSSMEAVKNVITGKLKPTGKLPVTL